MKRADDSRKKTGLDSFVEGISLLILGLGRHPESSSILTYGQETLLTLLSQGGKMSLKDVKSHLHINTFQMSRLLSSLENYVENKNRIPLVVREVNEQDKRQWVISISDNGQRMLTEELHRRKLRVKKILDPFNYGEKKKPHLTKTKKKKKTDGRRKEKKKKNANRHFFFLLFGGFFFFFCFFLGRGPPFLFLS